MTKLQYAQYLGEILEEEIDVESDFLEDQFYALFQCFMPNGENVEKIFKPLPNGELFLERLMPIYEATKQETIKKFDEGVSPGYFCPIPSGNEEELISEGKLYVENLIVFAEHFKKDELLKLLKNVRNVKINPEKRADYNDNLNSILYDSLIDWASENADKRELIGLLKEAYYSINCDYFLSFYLQYPRYKNKPDVDFLKPYFNIWKLGYYCGFENQELIIAK